MPVLKRQSTGLSHKDRDGEWYAARLGGKRDHHLRGFSLGIKLNQHSELRIIFKGVEETSNGEKTLRNFNSFSSKL